MFITTTSRMCNGSSFVERSETQVDLKKTGLMVGVAVAILGVYKYQRLMRNERGLFLRDRDVRLNEEGELNVPFKRQSQNIPKENVRDLLENADGEDLNHQRDDLQSQNIPKENVRGMTQELSRRRDDLISQEGRRRKEAETAFNEYLKCLSEKGVSSEECKILQNKIGTLGFSVEMQPFIHLKKLPQTNA